jgi:flagellar biosynthesis/type III secretory pathway protein FliH
MKFKRVFITYMHYIILSGGDDCMNAIRKAICLAVTFALLISTSNAIVEHVKAETVERMKGKPPLQLSGGEEASENISMDLEQQPEGTRPIQPTGLDYDSIFEKGYQEGYQAGYKQGMMDAYQWMISRIQEQMAGMMLEGPKIKQAVDALTLQVGDLD